jgi:hypothetical protein
MPPRLQPEAAAREHVAPLLFLFGRVAQDDPLLAAPTALDTASPRPPALFPA